MDADLLELLESELDFLVNKAHKSGLNYWQILDIFLRACVTLHLQATSEYRVKGGI